MRIIDMVNKEKVTGWRRHIHMYPEVAWSEHKTSAYIAEEIGKYDGIEVLRPTPTSVVAVLKGSKPGKTIGLRADIDALPIQEETNLEFASRHAGVMHACGHDSHAAMLMGAVDVLHQRRDTLEGTVKFIFQHAEELQPGGAVEIVATGVLDDCEMFFAQHVFPKTPVGTAAVAIGPVSANSDRFVIKIQGRGCHAASPHEGVDSLLVGAEIAQALNSITSRNVPSIERAVLSVCAFNAGDAFNVVPDTAEIKGTVRTLNPAIQKKIEARIRAITQGICAAYGATCEIEYDRGYDSMVNDAGAVNHFKRIAKATLPDLIIKEMTPMMGGEDFSEYSKIGPIVFVEMGAGSDKFEYYAGHHPKYQIDEDVLPLGAALYAGFVTS